MHSPNNCDAAITLPFMQSLKCFLHSKLQQLCCMPRMDAALRALRVPTEVCILSAHLLLLLRSACMPDTPQVSAGAALGITALLMPVAYALHSAVRRKCRQCTQFPNSAASCAAAALVIFLVQPPAAHVYSVQYEVHLLCAVVGLVHVQLRPHTAACVTLWCVPCSTLWLHVQAAGSGYSPSAILAPTDVLTGRVLGCTMCTLVFAAATAGTLVLVQCCVFANAVCCNGRERHGVTADRAQPRVRSVALRARHRGAAVAG